ncbi:MAG TPA: gluconate 2-dehydrogenase subunit 3 family protein [Caulobacterales bacterium]|nr:gluconate 2-dehydrogenase subunit 3 family protein [Caulobacterales bacterium]
MSEPITPSRRTTIAWMLAAAASPLALEGCTDPSGWRDVNASPVTGPGYGPDPTLMDPQTPWPLTLTPAQREMLRIAADMILPADDKSPGAGAVHVDAFIDEWVSAPYDQQRGDRRLILSGLAWLDHEAQHRNGAYFAALNDAQRRAIFDDVAYKDRVKQGYGKAAAFFNRLRGLVIAGFYTMPEGVADIGYMGNSPIIGPYPGPSGEALAHLRAKLEELHLPTNKL